MNWPASTTTTSPCVSSGAATSSVAAVAGSSPLRPAADAPGDRVGLGPAQRLGLGLAAALGDRLGQVGEHDREPQPDRDQPGEHGRVADRQHGGEDGADLHDEHDRVAPQSARVELGQRARQWTARAGPGRAARRRPGAAARCARDGPAAPPAASREWGWSSVDAFRERPEREGREVGECDDDEDHADEHADELRPVRRQRAAGDGHRPLPRERAGQRRGRARSAGTGRRAWPARARCCTRRC